LRLDHALKCLRAKRLSGVVERDGHTPAISVTVVPVTTFLPPEIESIQQKRADEAARREGTKAGIVYHATVIATAGWSDT